MSVQEAYLKTLEILHGTTHLHSQKPASLETVTGRVVHPFQTTIGLVPTLGIINTSIKTIIL